MVEVVLARAATEVPGDGWAFEPKWDGWRGVLTQSRLRSRHGKDLSRRFSGLLGLLAAGAVVDGEIVCWTDGRLDFAGLQRGQREGICFVAFDVLRLDGEDVRSKPYHLRRELLIGLDLVAPISVVESTTDRATALRWWEDYRAAGLEGLVAKRLDQPYRPGQRDWLKLRHRATVDLVVTGIVGDRCAPTGVVVGRPGGDGWLHNVGVSLPLPAELSRALAGLATITGSHAEPVLFGLPGQPAVMHLTVSPDITVEVATDGQIEHGRFRHAVTVLRIRYDLLTDIS